MVTVVTPPSSPWTVAVENEDLALENFNRILVEEQRLLLAGETLPLLALAEEKTRLANELLHLSHLRRHTPTTPADDTTVAGRLASIQTRAQIAEQTNRTNGELIQIRLRHNQQALTVLQQAAQTATLYGPDGQSRPPTGSGRTLGQG
ncbi:MAG: flagellar protein FlgN [Ferrovum sp.]|nr:flagellar protein FlgN [Ferrovum sp.]NDU88059.1 flagellar protein FlgN [Ferrovum sp.]